MEKSDFLSFLCSLEGFKVKFRELHWNAKNLSEHNLCDSIMSSITEYQDNIAEEGFTIFGKFSENEFYGNLIFGNNTKEVLNQLLDIIYKQKILTTENNIFCSISSILDEFIHIIRKYIYLSDFK
jgi:hypothetical protein